LNHAGWQDQIVGGWSANLAFQMESGQPFSVGTANVSTVSGGSTYAIRKGDPFKPGGTPDPSNSGISCATSTRNLTHWYNPCAFANPLSGTLLSPGAGPDGSPYTPQPTYPYPQYVKGTANAIAFLGGRSNQVYGPGYQRTDVSMFKDIHTLREQKLQLRVDCFNLLNTPPYGNPTTANISQSGGQIKGAERLVQSYTPGARSFQLSGKYIF
jgi:hypothetical protein